MLITPDLVMLDISCTDKADVLRTVARGLDRSGVLLDRDAFTQAVLARETSYPTSIGFETAIPHGKSGSVRHLAVAYARLKDGVEWEDGESVRYVFMLAVPAENSDTEHLRVLSHLSKKLLSAEFRRNLYGLSDKGEIVSMILQS